MKADSLQTQLVSINRRKKALEQRIATRELKKLMSLPAQAGIGDMDTLIAALIPLSSSKLRQRLQAAGFDDEGKDINPAAAPARSVDGNGNGHGHSNGESVAKRAHFSPELKSRIKAELEAGKKSVATLAREYGPSHPTIMSWKREWGMTQPRARK